MSQSVSGVWDGLFTALQGLFPTDVTSPSLVCAGDPGEYQPDLIVAMMGMQAPITHPTGGTGRSIDVHATIDVIISAYRSGGSEAQQPANQAAWAAWDLIVQYLRTSPNEKLGGACYNSFAQFGNMTPSIAWEHVAGMPDPVPAGRTADITATVTAWIRL